MTQTFNNKGKHQIILTAKVVCKVAPIAKLKQGKIPDHTSFSIKTDHTFCISFSNGIKTDHNFSPFSQYSCLHSYCSEKLPIIVLWVMACICTVTITAELVFELSSQKLYEALENTNLHT